MAQSERTARRITRRWPIISGLVALAAAVSGGALIAARESDVELDADWLAGIDEHRSPWWEVPSLVMNALGGGWFAVLVVPLGIILALCFARRFWAALYFAVAALLSVGVVQLLKAVFGRARPELMLVMSDHGSFPSGHVANAATIAVTLGLIFARAWVWAVGALYTVAMMLSRTYLGVHWLTDTIGGLVVGAAVALIVWAPLADRLQPPPLRGRKTL